jgi:hypothetical protein
MMSCIRPFILLILISISCTLHAQNSWPKEIGLTSGGKIIIYQPHPESLEGNLLTGRAAISVRETAKSEPVFGAIWAETRLLTNLDTRMATMENIKIQEVRFSNVADDSKIEKLKALLERETSAWNLEISLDNIISTLESDGKSVSDNFNTAPPKILFTDKPTTLVLIDGEPKIEKNKEANVDVVVNTPFLILKNPEDKLFYLFGGDYWYTSPSVTEGWKPAGPLSGSMKEIDKSVREQQETTQKDSPSTPPAILVSLEPAELIQTDGEADFQTIAGTGLLYVSNSENEILMDIEQQQYYVLLAGRWYKAPSLNGPWNYTAADALPEDFQKIPSGSEKDVVLSNVAGTEEAREARLDAQIPQTAKVDINSTDCSVTYDGNPQFQRIDGTSLEVAVNTSSTVLKSGNSYYAVENGVWFISMNPQGPWKVSTERPSDVDNIPPTSTAYNTKYVYIYDVTPTYVYMGYTPGYLGSYVYGPTVIYGTGYYYRPWYGAYYYPRPVTYGFGMHYNPWTGWNMSFTYSVGFFSFSYGWGGGYHHGGWWGPPVYRPPYRPYPYRGGYGPGRGNNNRVTNININNTNNIYTNRRDVQTRDRATPGQSRDRRPSNGNTRERPSSSDRNSRDVRPSETTSNTRDRKPIAQPSSREKNNVYTDRDGNIYKQQGNGSWQQRSSSGWTAPSSSTDRSNLNRQSTQRTRGQTRTSTYQRSTTPSAPRPAAGRRRGN